MTVAGRIAPDLSRTRNPAAALYFTCSEPREVPARAQVFLIETDGSRTAIDFPRWIPHPNITDVQLSAELLGIPEGTSAEVQITGPTGQTHPTGDPEQQIRRTIAVTVENLGVISGAATAALPISTVIESIHNRGPWGRRELTAAGWRCTDAPARDDIHPSWHGVSTSDELAYRVLPRRV